MYYVIYEYGGVGRYFADDTDLINEFNQSFNSDRNIEMEPYVDYLSSLTHRELELSIQRTYTNIDAGAVDTNIKDLMVIYDSYDEGGDVLICSISRFKSALAEVLNSVAEFYNSAFYVKNINKTVIAVVDTDHESLKDMFSVPTKTVWGSVEDFIADTNFPNEENNTLNTDVIETYSEAVRYWENMDFDVISNYKELTVNV